MSLFEKEGVVPKYTFLFIVIQPKKNFNWRKSKGSMKYIGILLKSVGLGQPQRLDVLNVIAINSPQVRNL